MSRYKCIIVEDEPLAVEVLSDYIRQVPFLELTHICKDALFAMDVLQMQSTDLMFLDIHLPRLKGLDLVRSLPAAPEVIITSAYPQYALEGYELNIFDYLLKPIEFSRFLMSVKRFRQQHLPLAAEAAERKHFYFNVNKKRIKVYLDEILFMESCREYIRITTLKKVLLIKHPLSQIEEALREYNFLRVHRSFIVAKVKIDAFTATEVVIAYYQVPMGRNYKELVFTLLEQELVT